MTVGPVTTVSYRFDLLDSDGLRIGRLSPSREHAATVTHDSGREIMRTLSGLRLTPADSAAVNPEKDRVRPVMIHGGGAESPLGVFLFADKSRAVTTAGRFMEGTLSDRGQWLAQRAPRGYGFGWGADPRTALVKVLADAGIDDVAVAAAAQSISDVSWPAGTPWAQIVKGLCDLGGLRRPWFDGAGHGRIVATVTNLADAPPPVLVYRPGSFYRQSPVETDDLLTAPNRFLVVGSGNTATPAVGYWDVPAAAPHSAANRGGLVVTETVNVQGVTTDREAQRLARQTGQARAVYQQVTFTAPPDPRHGAFDVVEFDGERWLETGWTLPLTSAGPMTHVLQKVYG